MSRNRQGTQVNNLIEHRGAAEKCTVFNSSQFRISFERLIQPASFHRRTVFGNAPNQGRDTNWGQRCTFTKYAGGNACKPRIRFKCQLREWCAVSEAWILLIAEIYLSCCIYWGALLQSFFWFGYTLIMDVRFAIKTTRNWVLHFYGMFVLQITFASRSFVRYW
jgi:hypothetical protein